MLLQNLRSRGDVNARAFDVLAALCLQFGRHDAALAALHQALHLRVSTRSLRPASGFQCSHSTPTAETQSRAIGRARSCLSQNVRCQEPLRLFLELLLCGVSSISLSSPENAIPMYEEIANSVNKSYNSMANLYPKNEAQWVRERPCPIGPCSNASGQNSWCQTLGIVE